MSAVRVVLHIGRLVLRGVPESDRVNVVNALQAELAEQLSWRLTETEPSSGVVGRTQGTPSLQALMQGGDRACVRATPILLPERASGQAESLGRLAARQMARSVAP